MSELDSPRMGTRRSFTIAEAAERTGLSPHTLRFYEQEGLLGGRVPRDAAGRRIYDQAHVELLLGCKRLRDAGMPVRDVRRFVELFDADSSSAEVVELFDRHQQRLVGELEELTNQLAHIRRKIAAYDGTSAPC